MSEIKTKSKKKITGTPLKEQKPRKPRKKELEQEQKQEQEYEQKQEQPLLSLDRRKRKEEASRFLDTSTSVDEMTSAKKSLDTSLLKEKVIETLKEIYDPEIPVNIYDLGLIYGVEIDKTGNVAIQMTLTSPMCPVAQTFPQTVQDRVLQVPDVSSVTVDLVWEPAWTKDHMSEVAKLQLNLF